MPAPIYTPLHVTNPAYQLRYTWSGWPSTGTFPPPPPLQRLCQRWEAEGLRLLENRFQPQLIQLTFSVTPQTSPVFFASRVKGRLQHAYRECGRPTQFSRKVAVGAIGNNHRADVEAYIARQVAQERFADTRHQAFLEQFTVSFPDNDLAAPT